MGENRAVSNQTPQNEGEPRKSGAPADWQAFADSGADPGNGAAPSVEPEDDRPRRVLDAGTSQELQIINYADDLLLHARRQREKNERLRQEAEEGADTDANADPPPADEESRDSEVPADEVPADEAPDAAAAAESPDEEPPEPEPDTPDATEPPKRAKHRQAGADQSLIIVRDALDQFQIDARTPPMPPPPVPRPPVEEHELRAAQAAAAAAAEAGEAAAENPPEATPPPPLPPRDATPADPAPTANAEAAPGAEPARDRSRSDSTEERHARLEEILSVNWDQELDPAPKPSSDAAAAAVAVAAGNGDSAPEPRRSTGNRPRPRPRAQEDPAGAADAAIPEPTIPGTLPPASKILALVGAAGFVAATVLMALRIEPFATWYYLFAWYPALIALNHFTAVTSPQHSLWNGRLGGVLALAAWSIPVWFTFEVWNLRLDNWYYVGLPDDPFLRRIGILVSFATVLPGIFFLEEAFRVRGTWSRLKMRPFAITVGLERMLLAVGVLWGAIVLLWPGTFFPLVWGVPVLLIEPWLHRRDESALLFHVSTGKPALLVRLLVAGAICGLFWEAANYFALGKWIYTVPGFERGKLFEMPLLGFLGFPPFALCCWTMARALVALDILPDWRIVTTSEAATTVSPRSAPSVNRRAAVIGAAVIFSALALGGVDRFTVDSVTPRPAAIPGIPDGVADYAARHDQHDVRGLLQLIERGRLDMPGASGEAEVALLRERCRLVLLRGIGTDNARRLDRVGVRTIDELAASDPADLVGRLETAERNWRPHPRRVQTWILAAQRSLR